ncbi:MAG: hypothetical protein MUE85_19795 [Microscillaceae bacterium]|jgi:hypothetical protein|nr:hypothetical protein [Microscillaceae bacterium]
MKFIKIILGCLIFTLPVLAQTAEDAPDTLKLRYRRYVMKKYYQAEKKAFVFEVWRNNELAYQVSAPKFSHLQYVAIDGMTTFDLDKDSVNNFIIQAYRGGEQAQTEWHILNLARNETPLLGKIVSNFAVPWLSDLNQDGRLELLVKDYTFANWNADFLASPYQTVVLSYQNQAYHLDTQWMRKDSLTYADSIPQLVKQAMESFYQASIKNYPFKVNVLAGKPQQRWGFIPPILWATMLDLIYADKARLAWDLVDKAWYEKLEGKSVFLSDFKQQLKQSPFWEDLSKYNDL